MKVHLISLTRQHVRKNNNTIEINGKRYDARTGESLSHPDKSAAATHHTPKPTKRDAVKRHAAKHVNGHAPKVAKTLMRQSVKKPSASLKRHVKAQSPTDALAKQTLAGVVTPKSVKNLDAKQFARASRIAKSHLISHFSATTSDINQPSAQISVPVQVSPAPEPAQATALPAHGTPKTTSQILEDAIRRATSHEQPPLHKPRKRARRQASIGAAAALTLLLAGFVGYQQLPSLRVHMASAKAGFNASLPGYHPAGYSLGQLSYSQGVVASQFHNGDAGVYTLTQKPSAWDSQTLRDNFVAPLDKYYQAIEAGGRTVYVYGEHSATWVNGGIWYQLQTDGSLSGHQLIQLATSL